MEAHWDGAKPGDFHIFAWPDEKAEKNLLEISIPRGASLILKHDPNGLFPGLKSVPPSERPPVKTVFFAFRIMLYIGFFMIAAALLGALLWWRGSLFKTRWYLRVDGAVLVDRLRRRDRRLDRHRERAAAVDWRTGIPDSGRHLTGPGVDRSPVLARFVRSPMASCSRWAFITSTG